MGAGLSPHASAAALPKVRPCSAHAPSLPLVPVPMRGNGRDLGPADQELRWFQPRVRQLQRGGTGLEGTLLEGPRRLCGVCLVEKEKDIAGCRSSTHRGVGWENRALGPGHLSLTAGPEASGWLVPHWAMQCWDVNFEPCSEDISLR